VSLWKSFWNRRKNLPRELNFRDPGLLSARDYYELYEMPLARAFYEINQRGIHVNQVKLTKLRQFVHEELQKHCVTMGNQIGKVVIPKAPPKSKKNPLVLNLSSGDQVIDQLKAFGMTVPKKRRANHSYSESADEESLNELFASTGNPFLKELLRVRELNKLLGTYIDVELENDVLYGAFFVTGTVSGRRSCRENYLGLGSNLQNQPKHTDLANRYRECLEARSGRIFVKCDQISAEDWLVQGIIADQSGDKEGFKELLQGVDRHAKLAAFIFNKPVSECGKDTPDRFMGKKVRHAGNYDMEAFRFAGEMAKEGHVVSEAFCQWLLERFHSANPGIKHIFHAYVQNELITKRALVTPFGFTRQFFSLRDYGDNKKVMKEGYAQIPQGTVGANTGMAILWLEQHAPGHVVLDDHDAVTLEVPDTIDSVCNAVTWLQHAFDRVIRMPKGLEFTIPIEVELGYNLNEMKTVKCDNLNRTGLTRIYNGLARPQSLPKPIISGQQPPLSQEPASAMSG
jgi:DNA polymerase I-like protein with 3'-5' exonuclease and polymerase domains